MRLLRGLFLVFILALLVQEGNMWRRRRRRRRCPVRNCSVSGWSSWGSCSQDCGTAGTQRRTRRVTAGATCGGRCPYHLHETRACNRHCPNGGTPRSPGFCACRPGFTGRCCRSDVNECTRKPCQHICVNTFGSYTCNCHACYTKVGTRCDLRMCKISNKCYNYGTPNPSNFCQHCRASNKYAWTNNNGKRCNDRRVQTKNDRCLNGACVGTPYSCLPCEQHDGNGCPLKAEYCVIQHKGNRTCFSNKQVNPSNQCQKCDANNNQRWTDTHGSPCNDQNVQTKNDRCESGRCVGTPYSCLSCEQHDGTGCPLKAGYCVIDHQGNRTCFSNKQVNPSNQCQLCKPSISDSSWTNKTIVNGNWTSWEDWSVCSKSCKSGNQSRRRSCTNPPPSECGKTCLGHSVESRTCNTQPCPVNGNWTRWGSWSECSKSCEGGIQRRTRKCFNPPPIFGGRDCTGPNMESRECNKHRCPVDCKSSMNGEYPHYSNCSKYVTCYAGKKHVKCCRAGFHFNPVIKRCDLPQNVNCTTREEQYAAIGCFTDRTQTPRAFTKLVADLRKDIDWYDLKKTIQTCAQKVREICGWKYFGIQFYGECWSGQDKYSSYDMLGKSTSCVVGVGKGYANFVYKLID